MFGNAEICVCFIILHWLNTNSKLTRPCADLKPTYFIELFFGTIELNLYLVLSVCRVFKVTLTGSSCLSC